MDGFLFIFWVNIDTTRYSATEFGRNKPTNFRLSGTLRFMTVLSKFSIETEFDVNIVSEIETTIGLVWLSVLAWSPLEVK